MGEPHAAQARVIIVSAHRSLGPEAFETGAVDYLLKPASEARLLKALEKARRTHRECGPLVTVFRGGAQRSILPLETVSAVLADGDYTLVHAGHLLLLDHRRITEWQELLDPTGGVRLDRSTLVRPEHVVGWQPFGLGAFLQMLNSRNRIELGRAAYRRFREIVRTNGLADNSPATRTVQRARPRVG